MNSSTSNYGNLVAMTWREREIDTRKKKLVWASNVAYCHILKINDMEAATQKMRDAVETVYTPDAIRHVLYTFTTLKYTTSRDEEKEMGISQDAKQQGQDMFGTVVVPRVHTHFSQDEQMDTVVRHSELKDRLQLYFGPHFKVKSFCRKKQWSEITDIPETYTAYYSKISDLYETDIYLEFYYKPSQNMLDHIEKLAERYKDFESHDPCIMSGYVY